MAKEIDVAMTGRSGLELFPLKVKREAGEYIVGRPATGSYVVLSDGAVIAVDLLCQGRSVADASAELARECPGQEVRLRGLLETLLAAGLIKAVDGTPLPEALPPRRYHLKWLRRRHVAWAFSPTAAAVWLAVVGSGVGLAITHPEYLPRVADARVTADPAANLALLWGVSLLAMAAHELAHLVAATFLGVQASFALSNRLFFAVAQTDLSDLWLVDRRKRYLAYAAGMMNDLLLASAAVIALWLHDQGFYTLPVLLYGTLQLGVLVLLLGLLWQFNFYLRTDVYYLLANFTGCRNLSRDATAYLKGDPLAGVPERERAVVRGFAVLKLLGTAGVTAIYLAALLLFLFGARVALPGGEPLQTADRAGVLAVLASLGLTGCWLAYAIAAKRRRRPRVRYRLVCPEDL